MIVGLDALGADLPARRQGQRRRQHGGAGRPMTSTASLGGRQRLICSAAQVHERRWSESQCAAPTAYIDRPRSVCPRRRVDCGRPTMRRGRPDRRLVGGRARARGDRAWRPLVMICSRQSLVRFTERLERGSLASALKRDLRWKSVEMRADFGAADAYARVVLCTPHHLSSMRLAVVAIERLGKIVSSIPASRQQSRSSFERIGGERQRSRGGARLIAAAPRRALDVAGSPPGHRPRACAHPINTRSKGGSEPRSSPCRTDCTASRPFRPHAPSSWPSPACGSASSALMSLSSTRSTEGEPIIFRLLAPALRGLPRVAAGIWRSNRTHAG